MSIRLRTGFSFRVAAGPILDVMSAIIAKGWKHAPITDRASAFGWVQWRKACVKAGLKPIYGVELAVSPSMEAKRPVMDYWTFLASNSIRPLNDLIGLATRQFRYEPLLSYEQALSAHGVIKIIGRRSDVELLKTHQASATPNLYVAASPSASNAYLKAIESLGIQRVAAGDNFYPTENDEGFWQVLAGRNAGTQTYPQYIQSDAEWQAEMIERGSTVKQCKSALSLRDNLFECCNADLPRGTLLTPKKPKTLLQMCKDGAKRTGIDLKDKVYAARLKRELDIIAEKKFEDYFYVVADMVMWARQRMTVGPARGSSCGSLVCYLLGITTVDPIPYGLLFERFISLDRSDMPDIDCDFSDDKRDLVFDFLATTYGKDRMARLGTVSKYGTASALNESAAALNIQPWLVKPIEDVIVKRAANDALKLEELAEAFRETDQGRAFIAKYPGMMVATRMQGHPRHGAQHACGVIITNEPVANYVAIDARSGSTHCDKKDAEDLDLLKIDCLGLTQLSVFEDALTMLGLSHDYLDKIPLDDAAAFSVLNDKHYAGIFQFQGQALIGLSRSIKFTELNDIVSITALGRPGPLSNGSAAAWTRRKMGQENITYLHKSFQPFTESTYGILVYQEQIMRVCREIGGLSWEDVSVIRRNMAKSMGPEQFGQFAERWMAGAIKNGLPADILPKIWSDLCTFGGYGFNLSHSVAYGIVSYQCCWLKAHYPMEFCAATLQHESDPDKQIKFLRELAAEGIGYVPVSEEHSTDKWRVAQIDGVKKLVGPISSIVGIGPKLVQSFVSAKKRNEPLPERVRKLLQNPKTPIDSLWPIRDAINRIMPDPRERNIYTMPTEIQTIVDSLDRTDHLVFCVISKMNVRDENEQANVEKRGGTVYTDGYYSSLSVTLRDDTGIINGRIDRFKFRKLAQDMVNRGRLDKALYAIKGSAWGGSAYRGFSIDAVRYLGDI